MLLSLAQKGVQAVRTVKNSVLNMIDPPVVVLIYHRVTTLVADPQLLAVSPENFRAQLKYLKENFNVVRFEDDWSGTGKPAVAITFDDGYADNALEALPIIEEVGVPATFFVATGTIGTPQEFWWDELEALILGEGSFPDSFRLADGSFCRSWPTAGQNEREEFYSQLQPLMKGVDARRRGDWLRQLREWAGAGSAGRESHRALSLPELRWLGASRWVTIGAHTITHSSLGSLPVAEQREEIVGSRRALESWLGREVTVFSYPFGTRRDFTAETVTLCKEGGFAKTAANFPGQAHRWTDRHLIPRQLVRNWDLPTFVRQMERFRVL